MASRQEEKEARRRARLEQEAAERKAAARQKRLQLLGGGVVVLGIIAAIVVVIATGGSDGNGGGEGEARAASADLPALPAQQETNVDDAAEAAGCELTHPADEGRGHENRTFTPADYKTNPPTSGTHFPEWAQDGVYDPGNEPALGELVHTLEHGRINVQYAPGTPEADRDKLEAFVADNGGYHMLLYQNPTDMPYKIAATAWDQMLGCEELSDKTWDALRTFRDRYIDQGPEKVA
jgi:Protein of unknown function (DUF3105)